LVQTWKFRLIVWPAKICTQTKEVFGDFYFGQQPTRVLPFVLTDLGWWNGFGTAIAIWSEKKAVVKEFRRWMEHCESQIEASDWRIRVVCGRGLDCSCLFVFCGGSIVCTNHE
jgi:hypothetical protein